MKYLVKNDVKTKVEGYGKHEVHHTGEIPCEKVCENPSGEECIPIHVKKPCEKVCETRKIL